MPCPHFEPQHPTARSAHANARLPLIDEYGGLCHAGGQESAIPADARFRFCNHGYSRGECGHQLNAQAPGAIRFELLRRDGTSLEVLVIEEQEYAPVRWFRVCFESAKDRLDPEPPDVSLCAQVRAFCASYLRHFSGSQVDAQT